MTSGTRIAIAVTAITGFAIACVGWAFTLPAVEIVGIGLLASSPILALFAPESNAAPAHTSTTARTGPAPSPTDRRTPAAVAPSEVTQALLHTVNPPSRPLAAHLWVEDTASSTLRLISAFGSFKPENEPLRLETSSSGRALLSEAPVFEAEGRISTPDGVHTMWRLSVPITTPSGRGVAALDLLAEDPDSNALIGAALALMPSLHAAITIHVAQDQARAAESLLDSARELSRFVDQDAIADALLARAVELCSADTGSVMLKDGDGRLRIVASAGLPNRAVESTSVGEGEGIAGWVLTTGKPVVVEDLEGRGPHGRRHGIRSAASVPIADEDGIIGVLNVGSKTFGSRLSLAHRDALETLGRIGAVALRNASALEVSRSLYFDTLKALAVALETKDPYAQGSAERVVDLATALGERMGLSDTDSEALHIASLLHDIGMSAAGDAVSVSDRPLSTVEWGMVRVHPVIAADVLAQAPALKDAIPIVYHHHERYDGAGYVAGLAADDIPVGARILAVADAFVAMTSRRPYRHAMSAERAVAELTELAGSQFDPEVVSALSGLTGLPDRRHSET